MDEKMVYKLPLPPSVNRMYRRVRNRVVLMPEARRFKWLVEEEIHRLKPVKFAVGTKIGFSMCIYPSDGQEARRDVDNGVKVVLDAFQYAGLYPNDNQVKEMHVKVMPVMRNLESGYVLVTFYELTE